MKKTRRSNKKLKRLGLKKTKRPRNRSLVANAPPSLNRSAHSLTARTYPSSVIAQSSQQQQKQPYTSQNPRYSPEFLDYIRSRSNQTTNPVKKNWKLMSGVAALAGAAGLGYYNKDVIGEYWEKGKKFISSLFGGKSENSLALPYN